MIRNTKSLHPLSWAEKEFKNIDLGDRRLDKRAALLAECMAANPMASFPQACGPDSTDKRVTH